MFLMAGLASFFLCHSALSSIWLMFLRLTGHSARNVANTNPPSDTAQEGQGSFVCPKKVA